MKLVKYIVLIGAVCAAFTLQPAKGVFVPSEFVSTLNVGPDGSSGTFGTVTVDLISPTTATITFASNTAGGFFFIDTNAADVELSNFSGQSIGIDAPFKEFQFGNNVNGFGTFDLNIKNNDGTAKKVSLISFNVTGTYTDASLVLALNSNGFDAAAHVVQIDGTSNPPTFFVAEAPGEFHIPDGGTTAMLLGLGLSGLGFVRRFVKR
jgi:hypothetical protein